MGNAGEEGEMCYFDGRGKALRNLPGKDGNLTWQTQGIGPLRVLFNKETKRARILLRAEPSGRAVVNASIHRDIDYKVQGTTLQFFAPNDTGRGMDLHIVRIKKEAAEELDKAIKTVKGCLPV